MQTSSWARISVVPIWPNLGQCGLPNQSSHIRLSQPIVIDCLCLELRAFSLRWFPFLLAREEGIRGKICLIFCRRGFDFVDSPPSSFVCFRRGREFCDEYAAFDDPPPLSFQEKGYLLHDVPKASCSDLHDALRLLTRSQNVMPYSIHFWIESFTSPPPSHSYNSSSFRDNDVSNLPPFPSPLSCISSRDNIPIGVCLLSSHLPHLWFVREVCSPILSSID